MTINLCRRSILITFTVATVLSLNGQARRVASGYPDYKTPCPAPATEIYEYDFVDVQPQFPGGDLELIKYINNSRRYPAEAYTKGIQGRVMCSFIVNTDGSISNIRIVKGVEHSLNREAVRLISEMPKWEAGKVNEENVPVHCLLPIPFRL